jgi:glutamate racemase
MADPAAPLLFFDSGIGGLSVYSKVRAILPNAPMVYAADYAGLPYGEKGESEIAARVPALLGRLVERYRPRLIVIACNTACTIALGHVRAALDVPVVGTVPAIKPAALATKTGVFGLLGTQATIRQRYVDQLEADFAADKTLLRHAAPKLVHAAEAKLRGETPDTQIFRNAISGLVGQPEGDRLDTMILGCTHFPLVQDELEKAAQMLAHGLKITFVDGSDGIGRRVAHLTKGQVWPAAPTPGIFVTTGSLEAMEPYRPHLAAFGLTDFATL